MLTCSMMTFLTFTAGFVCMCGVCSPVVVLGLSVRLSRGCGCCGDCNSCIVVCVACVYAMIMCGCESDGMLVWGPGEVWLR